VKQFKISKPVASSKPVPSSLKPTPPATTTSSTTSSAAALEDIHPASMYYSVHEEMGGDGDDIGSETASFDSAHF